MKNVRTPRGGGIGLTLYIYVCRYQVSHQLRQTICFRTDCSTEKDVDLSVNSAVSRPAGRPS